MASTNENKTSSGGSGGDKPHGDAEEIKKKGVERDEKDCGRDRNARGGVEARQGGQGGQGRRQDARVHEIYCARTPVSCASQSAKIAAFDATFVEVGNHTLWWSDTSEVTRRAMMRTEFRMSRCRRTAGDTIADPFTLQEASIEFDSLKGKYALLGVLVPDKSSDVDGD